MQPKNILIVDDDSEDCEFFTMEVEQIYPEINVSAFSSSWELFLHLKQNIPDLLFVDAFIQQESGIASILEIRENSKFQQLPIIMYTGSYELKNVANAFAAGASAYIVKPHTLQEVKSVLETTLQQDWETRTVKQYYMDGKFHVFNQ